jgi:hypothetical protein
VVQESAPESVCLLDDDVDINSSNGNGNGNGSSSSNSTGSGNIDSVRDASSTGNRAGSTPKLATVGSGASFEQQPPQSQSEILLSPSSEGASSSRKVARAAKGAIALDATPANIERQHQHQHPHQSPPAPESPTLNLNISPPRAAPCGAAGKSVADKPTAASPSVMSQSQSPPPMPRKSGNGDITASGSGTGVGTSAAAGISGTRHGPSAAEAVDPPSISYAEETQLGDEQLPHSQSVDDEATVTSGRTDADADANGSNWVGGVAHSPEQYVEDTAAPDDFGNEGSELDREPSPDQLETPQRHTGSSRCTIFPFFLCEVVNFRMCSTCRVDDCLSGLVMPGRLAVWTCDGGVSGQLTLRTVCGWFADADGLRWFADGLQAR